MNQLAVNTFAGVMGGILTFLFGAWDPLITLFMLMILIDYLSGLAASVREGKGLSSNAGFWGLAKKALMLLIIGMAYHMDLLFGTNGFRDGAICFYMVNELLSITENYGRLGLPLPDRIKQIMSVLKKDDNKKDADK
ncbi:MULTISPECIES: phage holin family protein [Paenibacillus]|uniref:Phage holin family protein n=1 Tax=Paenibacillus arenosi TaxID=2774142 RepID=A0ABR9AWW8_9BACL|nr:MULTISPECIES: phage holin family protein [Paenibacillus]MBD8498588.1 phage holin family protein [Paenibacillus arenosi]